MAASQVEASVADACSSVGERLLLPATLALGLVSLFLVVGDVAAPGGPLFSLVLVYLSAFAGGLAAERAKLPSLLGMLGAGLLLRILPYVGEHAAGRIELSWCGPIRQLALALILTRAGLTFDVVSLKRLLPVVARLAALPCLAEAGTIVLLATVVLGFPPAWAAMLGFVVSPISPAVVVPMLLSLQEQGYGKSTGISTMIVAAAPLDDVLSIAGFGICQSFAAGSGEAGWVDYMRVPMEVLLGVGGGVLAAMLVAVLAPPPRLQPPGSLPVVPGSSPLGSRPEEPGSGFRGRVALLSVLAIVCAFGLQRLGFSGASALAVLVLAVLAAQSWGPELTKPISVLMAAWWNLVAQPVLFGIVGATVAVDSLDASFVALGLGMLICSGFVRACAAFLAVGGRGLKLQERMLVAIAWMPKATVQAAIGGLALDIAKTEEEREMGQRILSIGVIAILFTAPLGSVLLGIYGTRWLSRETTAAPAPKQDVQLPITVSFGLGQGAEAREELPAAALACPMASPSRSSGRSPGA